MGNEEDPRNIHVSARSDADDEGAQLAWWERLLTGSLGFVLSGAGAWAVLGQGRDGAGVVGLTGAGLVAFVIGTTGAVPSSMGKEGVQFWRRTAVRRKRDMERLASQVPEERLATMVKDRPQDTDLSSTYGKIASLRRATGTLLPRLFPEQGYSVHQTTTGYVIRNEEGTDVFVEFAVSAGEADVAARAEALGQAMVTKGLVRLLLVATDHIMIYRAYSDGYGHGSVVNAETRAEAIRLGVERLFQKRPEEDTHVV